ncbi:hypothetical protein [Absidia glauca]|uniref:Uncharacterized protein n=1 Tax=Absidia glauca TaxID=4829 RepID=A0A163JG16_ABSGL|nr:hypothetical protein [Absidia glauca]
MRNSKIGYPSWLCKPGQLIAKMYNWKSNVCKGCPPTGFHTPPCVDEAIGQDLAQQRMSEIARRLERI